jgi:hypothetical protein
MATTSLPFVSVRTYMPPLLVVQRIWAIMPIPQVSSCARNNVAATDDSPTRGGQFADSNKSSPGTLSRQKQQYLNQILVHVLD